MKKIFGIILVVFIFINFFGCSSFWPLKKENEGYKAWLVIESNSKFLQIKGYCLNNTKKGASLRHQLIVGKIDSDGRIINRVSGSVFLKSKEAKCVVQLDFEKEDIGFGAELKIFKDKKLVAQDCIIYAPDKSRKEKNKEDENEQNFSPNNRKIWI